MSHTPHEVMHSISCEPVAMPLTMELTGPRRDITKAVLLKAHVVKMSPNYLCLYP